MSEATTEQPDPEERKRKDIEHLKAATGLLIEHFDSVQIIVTRHESDKEGAILGAWGHGNFYSRKGSVRDWLKAQDAAFYYEQNPDNEG